MQLTKAECIWLWENRRHTYSTSNIKSFYNKLYAIIRLL